MDTSDLAKRMKDYEMRNRYFLQKRIPVAIRVDMRAGHTFTKGFERPFDKVFMKSMQETAKYMCENMGNAKFAYVQSDEITIILVDYDTLETDCWFNYRTDKLCSISASMATMAFNRFFAQEVDKWGVETFGWEWYKGGTNDPEVANSPEYKLSEIYSKAVEKGAMFDARCFNIPKEEVTNLIYWRQLDATRNSIQMVGQAHFSHNELQDKTCNMIQDMLMTKYGINWNDFTVPCKRGTACIKVATKVTENIKREPQPFGEDRVTTTIIEERPIWAIDKNMPILKGEDRKYVDDLIYIGEE